ncbi:hypothetical protein PISMIDRAFT_20105 [Pisolithus microcarpus 441]|uniref:Uncharacterized protein n=1 Tax=Pisolithus microcarpus 441 TaxID=765257 RepID=A0A0C9Y0N2_9AGAM|nr:hypothetical protein PISMIDRAFT_20105 [Pisolithus microcarpus 441]
MDSSIPIEGLSRGMASTRGYANHVGSRGGRGDIPVTGENPLGRVLPVQWDATRTNQLVTWLLIHAADRHILFHDKNTGESSHTPPAAPGDKPSGCNKKEVHLTIASHIFANDPVYGGQWAANSERFQVSVMNRLISLKDKYCEHAKRLNQTGAGVAPGTDNLRKTIINSFPHFKDLDLIWRGNPSFDARPFTSNQQTNHAEDMLSLVQRGATCPGDNMFTAKSSEPTAPQVNLPANDQGDDGTVPWSDYSYGGMGEDVGQEGECMGEYDLHVDVGGTFDDDSEMHEEYRDDPGYPAGVRTWEAVPAGVQVGATSQMKRRTMSWDLQDSFKFAEPLYHHATPTPTSCSVPTSVSSCSRHHFLSPYSQSSETSLTRGRKSSAGRAKTDMQEQLDSLRHEAESLRGEQVSSGSNKYKYAIHSKELVHRWEEAIHQQHEAELNHKCHQESKQLEIERTTTQAQLFEKQAEALHLQIQLAEIEARKGADSTSGNAGVSEREGAL